MAYEFVADAEKMQDLHNDLVNTAKDITTFIEEIYSKVNDLNSVWSGDSYDAFKSRCESYRTNLEELPDVLNAFAADMGTLSSNTSTMVVSMRAILDCSDLIVNAATAGISAVQQTTRAKDSSGAYIPDTNTFESKLTIPADTKVGTECWACAEVGDPLYVEALKIQGEVNSELAQLEAYKKANLNAIMRMPEPQRSATLNYLNNEIVSRKSVSGTIADATKGGTWVLDGPLFNCTSVGLTGNQVVGWTQQSTADDAVKCAKNINKELSQLSDFSDIEAYMMDCGLGSIGG